MELVNTDKRTSLFVTAEHGHETIVQRVLDRGADVNARSRDR